MKDLSDLADLLQRFQRLDDAASSHCSVYDLVILRAMQHSLSRLEQGVHGLRERLVRRGELYPK